MLNKRLTGAGLRKAVRRGMFFIMVITLGAPYTPVKTQAWESVKLINNLEHHGIRLIGPTDDAFDDEIKRYLERNSDKLEPLIRVADSLAVLVKSESPKQVLGISLRWEFVSDNDRTYIHPQAISSPGALMGMVPLDPSLEGKTGLLYGSNVRFFSPLQGVENVIVNSGQTVVFPASKYSIDSRRIARSASQAQSQKESMFKNIGTCRSVAIDGILFDDGTFVGENQTGFFEAVSGSIDAIKDFLKNLRLATTKPNGLSRAIVELAEKDLAVSQEAPGLILEDKYRLSYHTAMKNIQEQLRRQRAAGLSEVDIAQKEFLDRYTNFVALKKQ